MRARHGDVNFVWSGLHGIYIGGSTRVREERATTDRFTVADGDAGMKAAVTTGNRGYEMLEYRDVPIPRVGAPEARPPPPGRH